MAVRSQLQFAIRKRQPPKGPRLFLVCALGVSVLACLAIFLQSTRLFLPPQSYLSGAPHSKALPLFFLIEGAYIVAFVLLLLPLQRPRAFAVGTVCSTCAIHFAIGLLATLGVSLEGLWGFKFGTAWMKGVYPFLVIYLLMQMLLFIAVPLCYRDVLKGTVFFVLGGALALIPAFATVRLQKGAWLEYENYVKIKRGEFQNARDTVRAIGWCAIQYRAAHPQEGYPKTLEAMAGGSGCAQSWSLADEPDYTFSYQATLDSGYARSFFVQAIVRPDDQFDTLNYAMGPSGIVLFQGSKTPDLKGWQAIADRSALDNLFVLRDCLQEYAATHPGLGYPRLLTEVEGCFNSHIGGMHYDPSSANSSGNYSLTYTPAANDGYRLVRGYKMEYRCLDYGVTCLRSLYADQGGTNATTANRDATVNDPPAPECDLGPWGADDFCAE
jgi:hypothetical protein